MIAGEEIRPFVISLTERLVSLTYNRTQSGNLGCISARSSALTVSIDSNGVVAYRAARCARMSG
jgi:hypothetical protein